MIMRTTHFISLFATFLSFGAVVLEASPAQAAPCCSAPICQRDDPPPFCDVCRENCSAEELEVGFSSDASVYDEVAGICYATVEPELPGDDEADELARTPGCQ